MSNTILDSGNRTVFYDENGNALGQRDIQDDKGRCDLLPLDIVADLLEFNGPHPYANVLRFIDAYKETKDKCFLRTAIIDFCRAEKMSLVDVILEVSLHYRDGAKKYEEDNWKNGLPLKSYLSSASRHLLKHIDGQKDEAHNRGFVWNMLGALWTIEHKPELINAPFDGIPEIQECSETEHICRETEQCSNTEHKCSETQHLEGVM